VHIRAFKEHSKQFKFPQGTQVPAKEPDATPYPISHAVHTEASKEHKEHYGSVQVTQDPDETPVHTETSREHSKQLVSEQEIQNPDETPNPVSHAVHIETLKEH